MGEAQPSWDRVAELFDTARTLPYEEQHAWLGTRCDGDQALFDEVRSLLEAARSEADASRRAVPRAGIVGRRFGRWEATRLLGTGGMGSVLLARRVDGEFEQLGALKLVAAHLAEEYFLERLKNERQILANLSHPNITQLLDGGVTQDGTPYFVMEFVEGVRLDEYCDQNRLTIEARLDLFTTICEAVNAAHRALVAHLDLKPSNILVTKDGAAKLLDFGTAKLMLGAPAQTTIRALTPGYASPEQVRGERVTTACDIYALGVILHELLTGRMPTHTDTNEPGRMTDSITLEAAGRRCTTPTQLRMRLRGDLSLIVSKAMAREPERRYDSPAALAEDVRRFLQRRPVLAQRQTAVYRLTKFARRHRGAAAVTMILAVGLFVATGYAIWQQRRALVEAQRVRAVNDFLNSALAAADPAQTGRSSMTLQEWLKRTESFIPSTLKNDPGSGCDLYLMLASAFTNRDQFAEGKEAAEKALALAEAAHDAGRRAVARSNVAEVYYEYGQYPEALSTAEEAWRIVQAGGSSISIAQRFRVEFGLGMLRQYIRPADSVDLPLLEDAVRLGRSHRDEINAPSLSAALGVLAHVEIEQKKYAEAENAIREAIAIDRSSPFLEASLATHLSALGRVSRFLGRIADGERFHRESYEISRKQFGDDNLLTANQQSYWAYTLTETGQLEEADRQATAALQVERKLSPGKPWVSLATAAYTKALIGDYRQSEALAYDAIEALGPNPSPKDSRWHETRAYLGLALLGQKRYSEARPLLEQSLGFYVASGRRSVLVDRLEAALRTSSQR